ncbi:tyrosine--tRNA ligase [Acidithrix ferrooxidans]|uniref:Tyrosine--tRNA ligase n=1 Tax=Acidithrix ferrooxidans TaxID=1280514 RepID=A0A0D8HGN4_9ACTN|nr:tyrosine--tRNA ligase [Acidithrix ferrooxidans]KJF16922.1 tyrosine--tRNA ligase [Acidithrix ferrooxidans]
MSASNFRVSEDLRWRGLIYQVSHDQVIDLIDNGEAVAYIGFDPSGDSLHVGNLIQLLNLRRLQLAGNSVIALAGGATGMVGDPSGRSQERNLLDQDVLESNVAKIRVQLGKFLDFESKSAKAHLLNNADWLSNYSILNFLRDVGKHITVNQMMMKDSVRVRLDERDSGLSFTEFSYMLLQAADFAHLSDTYGCNLQMGASDQWGNVVTGIELIRKTRQRSVYGVTSPLLLKADGTKFGKSVNGGVYLDPERTSEYEFYQFFLRSPDQEMSQLLKFFTFFSRDETQDLIDSSIQRPEEREAQRALASSMTELVHGSDGLAMAVNASEALFSDDLYSVDDRALSMALAGAPRSVIARDLLIQTANIVEFILGAGLVTSKSEARKLIQQGGLYLNNRRIEDDQRVVTLDDLLGIGAVLLRKGKRDYLLVDAK